jgi:PAS domain S-box-containing protein
MKKKTATSVRVSKGKPSPSVRPVKRKPEHRKEPSSKKAFWLDDKLFRRLVENSSDALSLVDPRGKILYRSPSAKTISGFSDKAIQSENLFGRIWPEDLQTSRQTFAEMLKSPGKNVPFQIRVKNKDGSVRWIEGVGVNRLAEPGIQALVFNYRDLTDQIRAAKALEKSEKRYRNLFENARLAIFQCTPEGKILRVNNEFAHMFGYLSPEDVFESVKDAGKDLYADPRRRAEIIRLQKKDPTLSLFESLYRRKDGSTFWGRLYMRSATDSEGIVSHYEGFLEDITKNRAMDEAMRESEEKFRMLFQNSPAGIALVGLDGRYLAVNPAFCEIFGYAPKELLATDFFRITHPGDTGSSRELMAGVLQGKGKNIHFNKRYVHKDGHTIWAEVNSALVYGADGKPSYFVTHVVDITGKKQAEEALRESEEKYRLLFELSPDAIAVYQEGKIIFANPATARLLGVKSPQSLIGRAMVDFIHPDYRKLVIDRLRRQERNGQAVPIVEEKFIREDGNAIDVDVTAAPILYGGKQAHLLICRDISDRKQATQALRESEEKFRSLFANSLEGIGLSIGNRIVDANKATLEIFGYEKLEEFAAKPLLDHVAPESRTLIREFMESALKGKPHEEKFTYKIVRKNGEKRDVEISVAHLKLGPETYTQSTFRDVTERKRAEVALRESENQLSNAAIIARLGPWEYDVEKDLFTFNDQFYAVFKTTAAAVGGFTMKSADYAARFVHPEDRRLIGTEIRKALETEDPNFNRQLEHRVIYADGTTGYISVRFFIVKDAQGKMIKTYGVNQDITERKRAEEALRESEEKFSKLFHDAPVLIIITEIASGVCLDVNEEALRVFGYQRDELIGHALIDIGAITRADRDRIMAAAKTGGRNSGVEITLRAKDGRAVVGLFRGERISIAGRECMLGAMVDITERKKAEEDLTALALRHEALLAAIPEIVMEVDQNKIYTWANPAGKEFFGEDVIGKPANSYFEGEQDTYTAVQPLFRGSEDTVYVESWQRRRDGQKRLLAWWCRTLKDERGDVTGALSSAHDITEQNSAEEQIQILSRFPTENPNPVMRIAPDGKLLFANHSSRPFLDLWGIEVGQSIPEAFRLLVQNVYAAAGNKEIEVECGERIFLCSLTPIVSEGYVNLYGRDITDRKKAESSLARQAEELRQRNLELARLNELTERRMQQLAAMRTVDMAISSSFKSELVMDILLEQLTTQLNVHAADILIFHPAMQAFRFFCGRGFYTSPASPEYLRMTDSYAGRATQERRMVKVPHLDEKKDGPKIFPKIAKEGFVSYACLPLIAKGQIKGVMEICHREPLELGPEEDSFLEMLAGQAAIAIDNAEMFEYLQSSRDELQLAFNSTLAGWARALELRDRESEGETQRGADLAMRLAQLLGESENDLTHIYRGAILHDIGMISVPDSILLKPGPLSDEEWTIVRRHPQVAFDILTPVLFLRPALDVPHSHHEKWDGSGYPLGSQGEHIPLPGRIFAVVDVWNALRSDRPYRKAWTDANAAEYIRNQSGKQFDPAVVKVFFRLIGGH